MQPLRDGVRKATADEAPAVAAMLARAFDDDPFINFIVKQDARRRERLEAWARSAASASIALGETYITAGCEGAALWTPPGQPHAVPYLQRLRWLSKFAGPLGALRLMRPLALLDAYTPHEAHMYLRVLGVEPSMQRQGLGSRLMQPVLARCDAARIPAYLFSTKAQNVPLYERHGFRVLEEVRVPGAPVVWTMWREPVASPSS